MIPHTYMSTFNIDTTASIHSDIPKIAYALFPKGLSVLWSNDHCLLPPGDFHTSKDTVITYKIKNGIHLIKGDLQYIWSRIIFRTCQAQHSFSGNTTPTRDDYQHLFALAFVCLGYYFNTTTEQKRQIVKSILYFVDDQLYNIGVPGFSGIMHLDQSKIMPIFDRFYNLCLFVYKASPDASSEPITTIEP